MDIRAIYYQLDLNGSLASIQAAIGNDQQNLIKLDRHGRANDDGKYERVVLDPDTYIVAAKVFNDSTRVVGIQLQMANREELVSIGLT